MFIVSPRLIPPRSRPVSSLHPSSSSKLSVLPQSSVDGFTEAFVGGSVGVMSVAIIVELQKLKGKSLGNLLSYRPFDSSHVMIVGLEGCPYCLGNGMLLCAQCFGSGNQSSDCKCSLCSGQGLVRCLNCQGDGRVTPMVLQSKAIRNPDYADITTNWIYTLSWSLSSNDQSDEEDIGVSSKGLDDKDLALDVNTCCK